MSGVDSSELILLIILGLIVLGPKRLPEIANKIGSWVGQARRMTRAMKRQLEDELSFEEPYKPRAPRIAPPVASSAAPDSADPAYDYDYDPVAQGVDAHGSQICGDRGAGFLLLLPVKGLKPAG